MDDDKKEKGVASIIWGKGKERGEKACLFIVKHR